MRRPSVDGTSIAFRRKIEHPAGLDQIRGRSDQASVDAMNSRPVSGDATRILGAKNSAGDAPQRISRGHLIAPAAAGRGRWEPIALTFGEGGRLRSGLDAAGEEKPPRLPPSFTFLPGDGRCRLMHRPV